MPVSVLQGDPVEFFIPNATLASAAGRQITLNNTIWQTFACATFNFVTTATAGNRQWIFQIIDAQANLVWEIVATSLAVASSTVKTTVGPGVNANNINGGNQYVPSFYPMFVPPNSSIKFFDANNIDPNDSVSAVLVLTT